MEGFQEMAMIRRPGSEKEGGSKPEETPEEREGWDLPPEFLASPDLCEVEEDLPLPPFDLPLGGEDRRRLLAVLEALLFASPEPLSPARISEVVRVPVGILRECLQELGAELLREDRPFELHEHGGSFRLFTRREFYPFLLRLRNLRKVERLTPAALETLAIIAYRQPVVRADIEAIRGVKVGPLLRALLDRKLIRVVGRAEVPGAPLQYGTTRSFLDRFGLESLKDLPSLKEFKQGRI